MPEILRTVWEEHQPFGMQATLWELMQQGCTVPQAEALTPEGWKNLYELEVRPDLPIATLNPDTGAFEWQPFVLNVFDYDGSLVHYKGQRIDHVLTPGHDVWVQQSKTYTVRNGKRWDHGSKWRKRKASETSGTSWSLRGGADDFVGRLVMPTVSASRLKPEYVFPTAEAMVRFIGWWVSEGSSQNGFVRIGQSLNRNPYQFAQIQKLLEELKFGNAVTACRDKHGQIHALGSSNIGMERWLFREFGQHDKERRLPAWVKELPLSLLDLLLETLRSGDGDNRQDNPRCWRYSTISQRLADDVQEIAIKLGYLTAITCEERSSSQQTIWRVHIDPCGLMSVPNATEQYYKGQVWCPTVANGLWFMRLNGRAVVTGNSVSGDCFIKVAFEEEYSDPAGNIHPARIRILPLNSAFCFPEYHPHDMSRMIRFKMKYRFWGTALEGTRQVFSYTELWTEDAMQAFINDELVESQENPLGVIPFVHISNTKVPSSPWGLSDIQDITDLNRQYNETALLAADIINYYASPVTVITGARANNLERGPKKVWAIPSKDARVENLSAETNLDGVLNFLELIKGKMHEISGIPVNALGQELTISNTSGVALHMTMLPLIQKNKQKTTQYSAGLQQVNEVVLRAVALYMPEMLLINPEREEIADEEQLTQLDPRDPLTYRNTVEFMSPLPLDKLVLLNEITAEMQLGLQSKEGALRKLGEGYPREKLEELLNELQDDALEQGALDMLRAHINGLIELTTGQPAPGAPAPGPGGGQPSGGVRSAGGPNVNQASQAPPPVGIGTELTQDPELQNLYKQLTATVAGTKLPQVRNPSKTYQD